ncbi:MAG: ABC transporter ATP-binding protein [Endozoicomonas sp.]
MNWLAIEAQRLTRQFGNFTALDRLDLAVPEHRIHGLVGPNGSGKSTTLAIFAGFLQPSSGWATALGLRIPEDFSALKQHTGYMSGSCPFHGHLTVEECLKFMARIYGLPVRKRRARLSQLLTEFDLQQVRKQSVIDLSGSHRQCLALAAATIHWPELLFLDEPTRGMAPESREYFWEKLDALCHHQGTTILLATHQLEEAERCHSLTLLESGEKRAEGTPKQLVANIDVRVIEISGNRLDIVKERALTLPEVYSARIKNDILRILIDRQITEPLLWLKQELAELLPGRQITSATAGLKDVFIRYANLQPALDRQCS